MFIDSPSFPYPDFRLHCSLYIISFVAELPYDLVGSLLSLRKQDWNVKVFDGGHLMVEESWERKTFYALLALAITPCHVARCLACPRHRGQPSRTIVSRVTVDSLSLLITADTVMVSRLAVFALIPADGANARPIPASSRTSAVRPGCRLNTGGSYDSWRWLLSENYLNFPFMNLVFRLFTTSS